MQHITASEAKVFKRLHNNPNTGYDVNELAKATQLSHTSVRNAVKTLLDADVIRQTPNWRPTLYVYPGLDPDREIEDALRSAIIFI